MNNILEMEEKKEFKYKRKNSVFGFKFKLLARTPQGALLGEENAIKRCATIVYAAFIKRGLVVSDVFFKPETLDFVIVSEKDLISMNSLDKEWVRMYKTNWGKTFYTATIGQYVIYDDQFTKITQQVSDLVRDYEDGTLNVSDIWFRNEIEN